MQNTNIRPLSFPHLSDTTLTFTEHVFHQKILVEKLVLSAPKCWSPTAVHTIVALLVLGS